jgi:hypothetical protein
MSVAHSPLTPSVLGVVDMTDSVQVSKVSEDEYQEVGFGGSADVLWCVISALCASGVTPAWVTSGTHTQKNGHAGEV